MRNNQRYPKRHNYIYRPQETRAGSPMDRTNNLTLGIWTYGNNKGAELPRASEAQVRSE